MQSSKRPSLALCVQSTLNGAIARANGLPEPEGDGLCWPPIHFIGDGVLRVPLRRCSRFLLAALILGASERGLAAVPLELEGTSLPFFELALLDYQPQFRRIVAQTVIGNLACAPASETIPAGTYSLRLDGRDYRLSNLSSGSVLRYDLATGRVLVRVTRFDELTGQTCASTGSSSANLRLRLNQEAPLALAQGVVYRTAAPRRIEARVAQPVICFDFGALGGNLRLDLTDSNGRTLQLPAVQSAAYDHGGALLEIGLAPLIDCFGFAGASAPSLPSSSDLIFASGIEEDEVYPDLVVSIVEVPTALEQEFAYRIEVRNVGLGVASAVSVGDFYPKTGTPSFVDGTTNWTCTAHGGASCGSVASGNGHVAVSGATVPAGGGSSPPRLVIDVLRTFGSYTVGDPLAIQAAATLGPASPYPDRHRPNNYARLNTTVPPSMGPVARPDDFAIGQNDPLSGNVFADNGHGPDHHLMSQPFSVVAVQGVAGNVGAPVVVKAAPPWGTVPATVTIAANGALSFDPGQAFIPVAAGQTDTATFTYTIGDSGGFQSTATVTVTVSGVNDPPVPGNVGFDVALSGGSFPAPGVLQNSFDPDLGTTLSVTHVNGNTFTPGVPMLLGSGGILVIYGNGAFGYTPPSGASAGQTDSFTVTVSDGQLAGTLTVTMTFQ